MTGDRTQSRAEWMPGPLVFGRRASYGAAEWHAACLRPAAPGAPLWERERNRYHRAWLDYLDPAGDRPPPLVSVVMPAFDADRFIRDAVLSCLAQTFPNLEVVVVDDGSPQPVAPLLGDLGPRVRVIRQANRGPAAARNLGVRSARGRLVHFLDADDHMEPDAVESKVEAMTGVPDADLCFSDYHVTGGNLDGTAADHIRPPIGDEHCPTRHLLLATVRRFPFQPSTVLAARWILLRAGPFDPSLRQSEDSRCWFVLGMLGAKAIAVDRPLVTRRLVDTGLSSDRAQRLGWWARVGLMNLRDLLQSPRHWSAVGPLLERFRNPDLWSAATGRSEMETVRREVLDAADRLLESDGGYSPVPLAAVLLHHLTWLPPVEAEGDVFVDSLRRSARRAFLRGTRPDADDLNLWFASDAPHSDLNANRAARAVVARSLLRRRDRTRELREAAEAFRIPSSWRRFGPVRHALGRVRGSVARLSAAKPERRT